MTLSPQLFVVVSNAADGDIGVVAIDRASGKARTVQRCAAGERVMPMTLSGDQRYLYAATRGAVPAIVRCSVDAASGHLAVLDTTPIAGSYAYISLNADGRYLLGASYGQDVVDVYRTDHLVNGDGRPLQSVANIKHAHAVVTSADDRFAYATSLGHGEVICFRMNPAQGADLLNVVAKVTLDATFGPRHLRLSPCQHWLYVVSEFRASVAIFRRDIDSGHLRFASESPPAAPLRDLHVGMARPVPSDPALNLPPTTSMIWGADIHVRPDGKFVYVSERTLSKLLVYRVMADGAALEYASDTDTEAQPRGFQIDSTGTLLVACGEKSNQLSVYGIEATTGALTLLSTCAGGNGANWIELFEPGVLTHYRS